MSQSDRAMQFVIKTSKFCNLRCAYCYEMDELGKRDAMSRENLRRIYENIRDYCVPLDRKDGRRTEIHFYWHGGEPLLLPPQFYFDTFADQKEIFGDDLKAGNSVQTNLTVLDDERLRLLREGFDSVGVSIDLFGGLRVNLNGRDQQARVLRNMDTLRQNGIRFGCITVLTRNNLKHLHEICRFYEQSGIPFRLSPLFDGAFENQHTGYDLTSQDILNAYKTVVDYWLKSDGKLRVTPILGYIDAVVRHLTEGAPRKYYNKRAWNSLILVNTNGDCFSLGDPYGDPDWALGNLIRDPLPQILGGERMDRSYRVAEERMAMNCLSCKYFGSCDGYPIVEESANCREKTDQGTRYCFIEKQIHEYIEMRLRSAGLPYKQVPKAGARTALAVI